jgi:hypothetical protein
MGTSIKAYLHANGYKIHEDDAQPAKNKENIIVASKYFSKEIIQVKGLPPESKRSKALKEAAGAAYTSVSMISSFADTLFNSLTNFGEHYSNENADIAMALPKADRYVSIIERLHEYFTANGLSMKIYLVEDNGKVEVSNLNEK